MGAFRHFAGWRQIRAWLLVAGGFAWWFIQRVWDAVDAWGNVDFLVGRNWGGTMGAVIEVLSLPWLPPILIIVGLVWLVWAERSRVRISESTGSRGRMTATVTVIKDNPERQKRRNETRELVALVEATEAIALDPFHTPDAAHHNTRGQAVLTFRFANPTGDVQKIHEEGYLYVRGPDESVLFALPLIGYTSTAERGGDRRPLPLVIPPYASANEPDNQWDLIFEGPTFIDPKHRYAVGNALGDVQLTFLGTRGGPYWNQVHVVLDWK